MGCVVIERYRRQRTDGRNQRHSYRGKSDNVLLRHVGEKVFAYPRMFAYPQHPH